MFSSGSLWNSLQVKLNLFHGAPKDDYFGVFLGITKY